MGLQYFLSYVVGGVFLNSKSVPVKNYSFFSLLSTLFNYEEFGLKELSLNTIGLENIN